FPFKLQVDRLPTRFFRRAFGVVVGRLRVELAWVRVGRLHYANHTGNADALAAGVIDKDQISLLHLRQEVAGLVIANTIPGNDALRLAGKIINATFRGFGFNQPFCHQRYSIQSVPGQYTKKPRRRGIKHETVYAMAIRVGRSSAWEPPLPDDGSWGRTAAERPVPAGRSARSGPPIPPVPLCGWRSASRPGLLPQWRTSA